MPVHRNLTPQRADRKYVGMQRFHPRVRAGLWCAAAAFIADRASKMWVEAFLRTHANEFGRSYVITSYFSLTPLHNYGISFGWFSDRSALNTLLLAVIALAVCAHIGRMLQQSERMSQAIGCGLILGGAAGNLFDRLYLGAVFDFLDVHVAGFRFWTFNVADAAISVGAALLFLVSFMQRKTG